MKYLLEPIPKTNPYQKQQLLNPYQIVQSTQPNDTPANILDQTALRLYCDQCKKEVTQQVYCTLGNKDHCVGCFSKLSQIKQDYQVMEKLDFSLFETSWTAYQQVLLLDSLQKWGFGNWTQIKQYMDYFGAKFTEDQIQTHYNTFYLCDKTFVPRYSQALIQRKKQGHLQSNKSVTVNPVSIASLTTNTREDEMKDYTFEEIQDFSHEPPIPETVTGLLSLKRDTPKIAGYNSFRKQFEVQFDENAEKKLANLEFRDDDLDEERQVKFLILNEYNARLQKRYEVQDFIIEHRLLDAEYQKQIEESRTEYEKQAAKQLKRFMRFSSFKDHNELIRRVALEKQLKSIIQGLRLYRRQSHTGKLKQLSQTLKRQQTSGSKSPSKSRGRPRKIIHVDTSEKSTSSAQNSKSLGNMNSQKDTGQEELMRKLKINMEDLKNIVKQAGDKQNGESWRYKGVEVVVVEKKR